jgi:hypothetical protein
MLYNATLTQCTFVLKLTGTDHIQYLLKRSVQMKKPNALYQFSFKQGPLISNPFEN